MAPPCAWASMPRVDVPVMPFVELSLMLMPPAPLSLARTPVTAPVTVSARLTVMP